MFHTPDSMVFRYKHSGEVIYVLDSMTEDSIILNRCDTLLTSLIQTAFYSTSSALPAPRSVRLSAFKQFDLHTEHRDVFSISCDSFHLQAPVESFRPGIKHDHIDYRDTLDTWYLTNLSKIYILRTPKYIPNQVHTVFYSLKSGLMAIHGGPDEYDGFTRIR